MKTLIAALLVLMPAASCSTVRYVNDGQEIQNSKRIVFLAGGLVPLNNNKVKAGPHYEEKYTFMDYVFTIGTVGIISTRTIEKERN